MKDWTILFVEKWMKLIFTVDEINRIVDLYNKMKFKIEIIQMPHPDSGMVDYFKEL